MQDKKQLLPDVQICWLASERKVSEAKVGLPKFKVRSPSESFRHPHNRCREQIHCGYGKIKGKATYLQRSEANVCKGCANGGESKIGDELERRKQESGISRSGHRAYCGLIDCGLCRSPFGS